MHATNTFPVDRHPQYRHHPTTIRSIASGIIIEVKKNHIKICSSRKTQGNDGRPSETPVQKRERERERLPADFRKEIEIYIFFYKKRTKKKVTPRGLFLVLKEIQAVNWRGFGSLICGPMRRIKNVSMPEK
jgi:hypothetical protein